MSAGAGQLLRAIPEFQAEGAIKIVPGASVPLTDRMRALIDSKSYQRLRRIRQLSMSDRVYPSATHTRFSHGLGVFKLVMDYLRQLDSDPNFRSRFEVKDYEAIMLAGLLHDLGHYPYSHQLDHLEPFPKHEVLTIGLIRGDLQIEGENLAQIIWDHFRVDPERITALLGPAEALPPQQAMLKQIIDSPVDADKCDYLPRDSYYCGVDYGTGFDQERFIRYLVPSRDGLTLCIHEKGIMNAERFQLARYWMYRSVYWGHTVRALITMLGKASEFINQPIEAAHFPAQLLGFNDHNFLDWFRERLDGPGQELVDMVHERRQPFKRVFTVGYYQHAPEPYRRLQEEPELRNHIENWFRIWAKAKGLQLEPHHLIWDVPPPYKDDNWESFPIRLKSGVERPIAQESPVIDALSKAFLQCVRKIRLFCHPRLAALIAKYSEEVPDIKDLFH